MWTYRELLITVWMGYSIIESYDVAVLVSVAPTLLEESDGVLYDALSCLLANHSAPQISRGRRR